MTDWWFNQETKLAIPWVAVPIRSEQCCRNLHLQIYTKKIREILNVLGMKNILPLPESSFKDYLIHDGFLTSSLNPSKELRHYLSLFAHQIDEILDSEVVMPLHLNLSNSDQASYSEIILRLLDLVESTKLSKQILQILRTH